jgi:hypothetical protein
MSAQMNVAVVQVEDQVEKIKENYMIEYIKYCYENYDDIMYESDEPVDYNFEDKIEVDFDGDKEAMIQDHFIQEIVLSKQNYAEFYGSYDWDEKLTEGTRCNILIRQGFGKSSAMYIIGAFIEEKGISFIADLIGIELDMLK